jgi:transaldolase
VLSYPPDKPVATRDAYGNALVRLSPEFPELVSLDAEVSNSTRAEEFAEVHPKLFFEMYIAEQNMVGTALGLACRGKIPFVSTFAAFLSRAFDQIRMGQYSDANVKFVGSHAGVSIGPDGPSQMGLEDLALFRTIVDGVVLYPADAVATEKLVEEAARHRGIVYLRTARQTTPLLYAPDEDFPIGGSKVLRESDCDAVTIVAAGATLFEALKAHDELKTRGVLVRVVDLYSVKPPDAATLVRAAEETRALVTVEDHYAEGGLGEAVRSALEGVDATVYSLAVRKKPRSGKPEELLDYEEISAGAIVRKVLEIQNPFFRLKSLGQSLWLDYIRRDFTASGELRRLIEEDGLEGVTSNPALFDQAIAGSDDYDGAIRELAAAGGSTPELYEALALEDVRAAADVFRPVYDRTSGKAGYVSLEVNPHLAHDAGATEAEARRLWHALDRPNVFVKVPATREGLTAIRTLIAEGINVNVTLLFGIPRYGEVAEAYLAGLEDRAAKKLPVAGVASVASFFLSRIDVLIDPMLEKIAAAGGPRETLAASLKGQVAIASARVAYSRYREIFGSDRFRRLAARGAAPQRVLWASTGTKNPEYSDVKYVDALIGPETINTVPLETLHAYGDHGNPALRLEGHLNEAKRVLENLASLGIDLDAATAQLEAEGVEKFNKPYDALMRALDEKRRAV